MTEVEHARVELIALANLIERPPADDVLLEESVAMRAAAAIRVLANVAVEASAVAEVMWNNHHRGDRAEMKLNVAALGFLGRHGRLPKWFEEDAAKAAMGRVLP